MAVMQGLINQRTAYIQNLYAGGLVGEADANMKDLVPTMQHLATANKEVIQSQGEQIKNADNGLKFVQAVSLAVKDKPSFERFKMQMLQSGVPLNSTQAQLINMSYDQAKPFIDDWAKTSKVSLENQRIQAQIAQERAQAFASNMRGKVEQLAIDRDEQVDKDYKSYVANAKLAGTPDTKILSKTEWQEGLKHPGGKVGQATATRAYNIHEAFSQASTDLLGVAQMPSNTVLGTFAGMTGQSGSGLVSSLSNAFARSMTSTEQRQLQQMIAGLDQNMARALGGGYGTSGAKHLIEAYKEQMAKSGDKDKSAITAMFLARMKQELAVLNKSFKTHPGANEASLEQQKDYLDQLNQAIPFETKDVIAATRGSRKSMTQSLDAIYNTRRSEGEPVKPTAPTPAGAAQTVTVGDKTYTRPAAFTDDQWNAYKKDVGAQ